MFIAAQIFGVGAMISLFLLYQQKTRSRMLAAKLSADLFWVVHYLCLGAVAGAIPNFVGTFRELIFLQRKRKKWAGLLLWPVLFIGINWALGIRSFRSPFDLLPIGASTFVTLSLWIDRPRLTKLVSLPVSAAFLIYDCHVGSYAGIVNEAVAILSILIYFVKARRTNPMTRIFSEDCRTEKELIYAPGAPIGAPAGRISAHVGVDARAKGEGFAGEIRDRFVAGFEKPEDRMVHVSTFAVVGDTVYMTYYANTHDPAEDPTKQTARLAYAPLSAPEQKTVLDLQTAGDTVEGKVIEMVYDTVLMQKDEDTLYLMWTARTEGNYYRFYRPFTLSSKTLGEVRVNRFKVGDTVNDFSSTGIRSALADNGIPCKKMYSDIGIMQKQSFRRENGEDWCYTGTYSGDFNCIVKSKDLITWEYVSQPDFINDSKWENATYVWKDKVYYFVRQQNGNPCGFLTAYDLISETWASPVEVEDCQSRGDFIIYGNDLYLFHAPIDRNHIGILRINTENLAESTVLLQAKMHTSCFYPFVQYYCNGELALSYTEDRKHVNLAEFTLRNYL